MKTRSTISILALTLFASFLIVACNEEHCPEGQPDPNCLCTLEYDPVCGCDGITYGNACQAGCSGVESTTPGACD